MSAHSLLAHYANPVRLHGPLLEAPLPRVFIGELCLLRASLDKKLRENAKVEML